MAIVNDKGYIHNILNTKKLVHRIELKIKINLLF